METKNCTCGAKEKMVITCSGAADVGYVADQLARKMARNGNRKMSCMALFSSCGSEKLEELKASDILVIDGCSEDCGKKIMQGRGITDYNYLRITDLGYEKGKTPTSQQTIQDIYGRVEG